MDVDIKKAEEKIEYLSSDSETLTVYKARERSLHERDNMISDAIEEGEERKAIKIAKNLLRMGLTVEQVGKGSELPIEKVMDLKNKMNN